MSQQQLLFYGKPFLWMKHQAECPEGEQVGLLCSMGSLESCCKLASSFPKNRFLTPNIVCLWAQVQEETHYLSGIILQLGFSPSFLKHFFISKGEKWASAYLVCSFGFWVLVFGLLGSPPLTPLKKKKRKLVALSLHEKFRSTLLYKALWGIFACLYLRKELTSHCLS